MSQFINFILRDDLQKEVLSLIPYPIPASEAIGKWYTSLPHISKAPEALMISRAWRETIKACAPFLDAMSTGYLIRSMCDIEVEVGPQFGIDEGKFRLTARFDKFEPISYHEHWQFDGFPLGDILQCKLAGKFQNPWIVKTSPGTSCLFVHPQINNPEIRFYTLSGSVATDVYPMPVELPFLVNCRKYKGKNFIIRSGEPICLVIPFRRDDWAMTVRTLDKENALEERLGRIKLTAKLYSAFSKYWRKKSTYK